MEVVSTTGIMIINKGEKCPICKNKALYRIQMGGKLGGFISSNKKLQSLVKKLKTEAIVNKFLEDKENIGIARTEIAAKIAELQKQYDALG